MITPIKQSNPARPEYGDILAGQKYVCKIFEGNEELCLSGKHLVVSKLQTLKSYEEMGIDVSWIPTYVCPFRGIKFYLMMPVGVLTEKGQSEYHSHPPFGMTDFYNRQIAFGSYSIDDIDIWHRAKSGISMSFLGHGYTSGTLPSDGGVELKLGIVQLSNGDELLVAVWVWYNK